MDEMVRVTCSKCGFDGYSRADVGHVCMRFITLHEYEKLKRAEKVANEAILSLVSLDPKLAEHHRAKL